MEFNLKINPPNNQSLATYDQHYDKAYILLNSIICPNCGDHVVDEDNVVETLNHEYIECICNFIRFTVKEPSFSGEGFDYMAMKWRGRTITHKCDNDYTLRVDTC